MQKSVFDIFGTQDKSTQSTVMALPKSCIQTSKGKENIRMKFSSVSDLPSKKALGDVGNKLKPFSDAHISRKLSNSCNKENLFVKPQMKTPLQNSNKVAQNKETPNLKSAIRTPFSDLNAASSAKKQSLQNPSKSASLKDRGQNKITGFENIINDDSEDLSWMQPDDVDTYEPIDDYEDIIPNSLRPSDEDIHRMVHFWEMHTHELECEFGPVHPLVEESGNEFVPIFTPDINLDEDLNPVPVPPMD